MSLRKCNSSQFLISMKPGIPVYLYSVDIKWEQPDKDGKPKEPLLLSQVNNDDFKKICRKVINNLGIFDSYVYDGKGVLYALKALNQKDLVHEILQAFLSEELRRRFVNPEGRIEVSLQHVKTTILSEFGKSVTGLVEDRTYRSIVEMVLSENATNRPSNSYIMLKNGKLYQTEEHKFERGLVWREGIKKSVHIIKDRNEPKMSVAMDFSKKVFFPSNVLFMDFLNQFDENARNVDEAEKLCFGLRLTPVENERRVLLFKRFLRGGENSCLEAEMHNCDERFALNKLIIKPDQPISLDNIDDQFKERKQFKERILAMNRFPAFQRQNLIMQQFSRLQLNNSVTTAFGITVKEEMLAGSLDILLPMKIVVSRNNELTPSEDGSFRLNARDYYKRAIFDKVVIIASEKDYQKTSAKIKRIIGLVSNKRDVNEMIKFQPFNLYSRSNDDWINLAKKIKEDYPREKILALAVDGPWDAHYFLKYAESQTALTTQHIMSSTLMKSDTSTEQFICHKFTEKLGGITHVIKFGENVKHLDINSGKVLILGIDVCHATGGNYKGITKEPSTIGISANYMDEPCDFRSFFFFGETREELIPKHVLQPYIFKVLNEALKNGKKIEKIVILRDGVDEGRYGRVVDEEVAAVKAAAKELKIDAKFVTFLITKKMTTRHFCIDSADRISSLPPRSFITFGTRYMFKQFYFVPHRSLVGTAISAMATILLDEIGICPAEAKEFILGLCYLHKIVNKPISIPCAIYNADLIAHRGQILFRHLNRTAASQIPRDENGEINYYELTRLLAFNDEKLPSTRYNA